MNKKAIALPFNWIFAIIVGAVIIVLAIYGTTRFIETGEQQLYTESAAKLISLLDPFETGLASGKSSQINFQKPTRTYYECDEYSNRPFGRQTIAFAEQTLGDKFGDKGGDITIKNKYVFAENILEGKNLYVFSKPFFVGYKVADMIIISSENYCFYQAPDEIQKEIELLNLENIKFTDDLKNCTDEIKVCWGFGDCEIRVTENRVVKFNKELYYAGDLIYAAIFSSPEIYECNIKRLKNKFNELALIYQNKANLMQKYNCGLQIIINLENIRNKEIQSSKNVKEWIISGETLNKINQGAKNGCNLW